MNESKKSNPKPVQKAVKCEDKNDQIDNSEIIRELRRSGSGFKDLDDYLEEFEEDNF